MYRCSSANHVLSSYTVYKVVQSLDSASPSVTCGVQVDAFKDFSPSSSGAEASSSEPSKEESKEESQPAEAEASGGEAEEASGSSGGDFPLHTVAGLPALSPTMSQGTNPLLRAFEVF